MLIISLIIFMVVLIILGLSFKKLVEISVKIQALEKLSKTNHRNIQIQTDGYKGEPISVLHFKVSENKLRFSNSQL